MAAIDLFERLVTEWRSMEEGHKMARLRDAQTISALEARVRELEGAPPAEPPAEPPDPPVVTAPQEGTLSRVPFREPPLKYNRGSWDENKGQTVEHALLADGALRVVIAQTKQPKSRVIRRDWGLQDPAHPPGGGAYLREPPEKLRRYELRVKIPEDYSGRGELCTLGLKFHTHTARDPAYLAFIAWTTTVRWRINHPDGAGRHDYGEARIKPGHTYSLAVEAFWSQGVNGRIRAWTDGKLIVDYKGPNYSKDEDKPPYLLVGAYFPSAIEEFSEVYEFSELRVGDV